MEGCFWPVFYWRNYSRLGKAGPTAGRTGAVTTIAAGSKSGDVNILLSFLTYFNNYRIKNRPLSLKIKKGFLENYFSSALSPPAIWLPHGIKSSYFFLAVIALVIDWRKDNQSSGLAVSLLSALDWRLFSFPAAALKGSFSVGRHVSALLRVCGHAGQSLGCWTEPRRFEWQARVVDLPVHFLKNSSYSVMFCSSLWSSNSRF